MRGLFFVSLVLLSAIPVRCQSFDPCEFSENQARQFLEHLEKERLVNDHISFLKQRIACPQLNSLSKDTLLWQLGRIYYGQTNFVQVEKYLSQVGGPLGTQARILNDYCGYVYQDGTGVTWEGTVAPSSDFQQLETEITAANMLELRAFHSFDSLRLENPSSRLDDFDRLAKGWRGLKRKSPVVAGLLSTAIPGLGKWYAGRPKQAFGTFSGIALFGLQAWEGFRKRQWDSPRFWVFGTLASVFYVANVWGSVLSINVVRTQMLKELHENLVLELSIPVHQLWKL